MTAIRFRSPVTRELRPYRGPNVPRPADAGDAFYVTSPFGPRADGFHGGLDIGNARTGYPLVAVADGIVLATGYLGLPWSQPTTKYASGNFGGLMVVLEHAPGVVSIYAHLSNRSVSKGERVSVGQRIGSIGDSGSAQGQAHVHFGIQGPPQAGVKSNPTTYGYGLDLDAWPLLTGTPLEVDDMRYPRPNVPFLLADIGPGNNLRSRASLDADAVALYLDPKDFPSPIQVGVYSYVEGDTWSGSTRWAWIGWNEETYIVHSKLLSNLRPTDALPVKPTGYTDADLKAARDRAFEIGKRKATSAYTTAGEKAALAVTP